MFEKLLKIVIRRFHYLLKIKIKEFLELPLILNYMKQIIYTAIIFSAISCSPKLQQPEIAMPQSYIYDSDMAEGSRLEDIRWWKYFNDTSLNMLIDEALINNRNLAIAISNVESAKDYVAVAKAAFLPSLSLTLEAESEKINSVKTNEFIAAPTIEWEVSLFGELRNTKKAALADLLSKQWNVRAVTLMLTAEIATTYFTLMQYMESYDIAVSSYELRQRATALVDSMHRYGMSDGIALEQAKSLVYSARSDIYKYRRAMEQTSLALDVLLGKNPGEEWSYTYSISQYNKELTIEVPIGIPSDILEHRPDVMESYYNMEAAAAEVGIARAERYPSISLTGEGGLFSSSLKDLSSDKPLGWSAVASITEPIYNFGKYKRKEQMKREEYAVAIKSYEQTILEALSDVETSLVDIDTYQKEREAALLLVEANQKISTATTALYRSGMGDYLSVIDAERELYTSQVELVEVTTQQYTNYINLFKSLGGGW